MRRPLVAGNWKMNGSLEMAAQLATAVASAAPQSVDTVLCPPAPYLAAVATALNNRQTRCGGQDCSEYEPGAYTGETAAEMLLDLGCGYVILGHSERRQYFADSDERVAAKVSRAHALGLVPILCVGESLAERQADDTETVVGRQLGRILKLDNAGAILDTLVVAYEPVWAIGTGESATPAQAQAVHAWIRQRLAEVDATKAAATRILYGGSVKPNNAAELFAMADIDGGLIGGASLDASSFIEICQAAA